MSSLLRAMALSSLFLVVAACATTSSYTAGKTPEQVAEAKQRYHAGAVQFDLTHYDEAIAEFQAAYAIVPDPAFLFNIAQSNRLGGHPKEAIDFYNQFLHDKSDIPEAMRKDVTDHISECLQQLATPSPPPDATPATN